MATKWMCHRITIGDEVLNGITEVQVESSVESLSDVARITLPFMNHNRPFDLESRFVRGQDVKIELGYDSKFNTEFVGYVRTLSLNSPCVIECEDSMWLMRREVKSKEFKNASVDEILKYVCKEIGGFTLKSTVSELKYDKFAIRGATAYEVLEKVKQQFGISIYAKGLTLFANLKYTERNGEVYFSFSENVKASSLQFVRSSDVKVQVKIRGIKKDNTATKDIEVGSKGGESVTLPDQPNITDQASLEAKAKEYLKQLTYTGYRGDLTSFGQPFCGLGWAAFVRDRDFPDRDGRYYIKAIKVNFSSTAGYSRVLSLGIKL